MIATSGPMSGLSRPDEGSDMDCGPLHQVRCRVRLGPTQGPIWIVDYLLRSDVGLADSDVGPMCLSCDA